MNKKYKDNLFVALFSDKHLLRELYNALAGTHYGDDVDVSINTLQNVLFMERRNDISFTIGGKVVVLVEHQATVNLNMPLRFLLYIARVYEKLVKDLAIYREGRIPIPLPEFYVAYNGNRNLPDYQELKLSDAFMTVEGKKPINLDLIVKVININHGHNPAILNQCTTLKGYAELVALVKKELRPNMSREEAKKVLQGVINYCIDKDILKDFLEEHSSEVRNMLYTKWNWDDYVTVQKEELREELEAQHQEQMQQVLEQNRQDQERIRLLEEENRRLRGEGVGR
jgi:hypothetical protein